MKKKDYELIANLIDLAIYDVQKTDEQREVLRAFAKQLAGRLEITEPKFDKLKFLTACGIESRVVNRGDSLWTEQAGVYTRQD